MGWDFIEYGDLHVHIHDLSIWTLRHFFVREAESAKPEDLGTDGTTLDELRRFFDAWDWIGPGVCTGTNLTEFVQGQEGRRLVLDSLFRRTLGSLKRFGGTIPHDYLQVHVNSPKEHWLRDIPTTPLQRRWLN